MSQKSLSEKRALLAKLLQRQAYDCPLSQGQQALWSIHQSAPDSSAYTMAWPIRLQGNLEVTALQQALKALVNRHAALRTTIKLANGEPIQTVQPTGTYYFQEHKMPGCSEQQLNAAIKTAYDTPFDLTQEPVLRVNIFQIEPQLHILLLTMHHVFGDASSITILANELLALYQAELDGEKITLPPLPNSYADFVRSEMSMLSDSRGEDLVQFWQQRLGGDTPILKLPTDYSRPAVQTYNGSSFSFLLSSDFTQQFKLFTQKKATTPFTLLLTVFQILLYRYTGQKEIWLGTPASPARRDPKFANLVGYLANTVVLPTTMDDPAHLNFQDILSNNKQNLFEVLEHSSYPFLSMVKKFQTTRDPSYSPLFQATLDYQAHSLPEKAGDLEVSAFDFAQMEGQFELRFGFVEEKDALRCRIYYNTDLFHTDTIERMAKHFQVLLTAIIEGADCPVTQLPLLTSGEKQQLQTWRNTAAHYLNDIDDPALKNIFQQQIKSGNNAQVYLLDTYHQLVPVGVPGQLYIGGLDLGDADINELKLPADAFVELELFGKTERLLQTEHIAKWNSDGNITPIIEDAQKESSEGSTRKTRYVYPRDALEFQLVQLWEELFDISPISVLDDFFKIGGDSLLGIRLIFSIQKTFGVSISMQSLFEHRTPEELVALIRKDYVIPEWTPLVCLQPEGEKSPLFMVHASGGSAFDFLEIAKGMGTERPFYAIQPRGTEVGDEFHPSIEAMAADYVKAIRTVQETGPYLLGGWSFGASVAFEMIRILEKEGETASLLIMIDTPEPTADVCKENDFDFLMDRIPHFYGANLADLDLEKSTEEKVEYLLEEVKLTGLFAPDIDQDYAKNWLKMYKHHNQLVGLYRPEGTINSRIVFFKPSEKIPFDEQMGNPSVEWKPYTRAEYVVIDGPGNHFSMVSPLHTDALVKQLKDCIKEYLDD
jgi:thioesterase domain-containing protein/acyl carrier protein